MGRTSVSPLSIGQRLILPGRSSDWGSSGLRAFPGGFRSPSGIRKDHHHYSVGHVPELHRIPDSPAVRGHQTMEL